MQKSRLAPRRGSAISSLARLASLALVSSALAPAALAIQGGPLETPYVGDGYVRELASSGPPLPILLFDGNQDGFHELAQLDVETGTLTIHEKFFDNDWRFTVTGISHMATLRGNATRLFGVQQGSLVEILPSATQGWEASAAMLAGHPSIDELIETGGPGSQTLLVSHSANHQVSLVDFSSGFPVVMAMPVPAGEGRVRDAALVDFDNDGVGEFALINDLGLRVLEFNGTEIFSLNASPSRAFLEVLPASQARWGKDLLLYHHQVPGTPIAVLSALNTNHSEQVYVDPLYLKDIAIADLTGCSGHEIVLSSSVARMAVIVSQLSTPLETDPYLGVDYNDTNVIDLDSAQAIAYAPEVAVADLDGDDDEDLVFADDRGLGLVINSEWKDSNERRAIPLSELSSGAGYIFPQPNAQGGGLASMDYQVDLSIPANATSVEIRVWYQENYSSAAPFVEVSTSTPVWTQLSSATNHHRVEFNISAEDPDSGVYYISFRPISPDPVPHPSWIGAWSPEVSVLATIQDERETIYQWTGLALPLGGDGAEGTTRRPIVVPPPTGPPN